MNYLRGPNTVYASGEAGATYHLYWLKWPWLGRNGSQTSWPEPCHLHESPGGKNTVILATSAGEPAFSKSQQRAALLSVASLNLKQKLAFRRRKQNGGGAFSPSLRPERRGSGPPSYRWVVVMQALPSQLNSLHGSQVRTGPLKPFIVAVAPLAVMNQYFLIFVVNLLYVGSIP